MENIINYDTENIDDIGNNINNDLDLSGTNNDILDTQIAEIIIPNIESNYATYTTDQPIVGTDEIYQEEYQEEVNYWTSIITNYLQTINLNNIYNCQHCNRVFFSNNQLIDHININHYNEHLEYIEVKDTLTNIINKIIQDDIDIRLDSDL